MDIEAIRELIQMMVDNELSEVDIRDGDVRVALKRGAQGGTPMVVAAPGPVMQQAAGVAPVAPAVSQPVAADTAASPGAAPLAADANAGLVPIISPMVGTFYSAPDPESEPFVHAGSRVDADTVVCIVEAMKVMNEIKAEVSGTIEKIEVRNEQAVEYGQVMFMVRPD